MRTTHYPVIRNALAAIAAVTLLAGAATYAAADSDNVAAPDTVTTTTR